MSIPNLQSTHSPDSTPLVELPSLKTKTVNLKVTLPLDVNFYEDDIQSLKIQSKIHSNQINNMAGNLINLVRRVARDLSHRLSDLDHRLQNVEREVFKPNGIAMNNVVEERSRRGSLDPEEVYNSNLDGDAVEAQVEGEVQTWKLIVASETKEEEKELKQFSRTESEIINRMKKSLDLDYFCYQYYDLIEYLSIDKINELKIKLNSEYVHEKKSTSYNDVLKAMTDYMSFAFDKAFDQRGMSAERSIHHMSVWLWLLGEDDVAEEILGFTGYGEEQLKAICIHYNLDVKEILYGNTEKYDSIKAIELPWKDKVKGEICSCGGCVLNNIKCS